MTQRHTGSDRIEYSADSTRVYGYNNETTEFGFRRLVVDAQGVHELDVTPSLIDTVSFEAVPEPTWVGVWLFAPTLLRRRTGR